jgi:flagellar hook assembly protein FlgD
MSFAAPPAPNPSRDRASFRLGVGQADAGAAASVRVMDVTGRVMRTLVDGALEPGVRDLSWDLSDDAGRRVPAGLYFLRVDAGSLHATHRLIVVR